MADGDAEEIDIEEEVRIEEDARLEEEARQELVLKPNLNKD